MGATKVKTNPERSMSMFQRRQNADAGASATTSAMTKAFYLNLLIRPKQVQTVVKLRATTSHR
jgi:hypothetical protein